MDLFRRFALGEIDAFETLVRQFQGEVYAWIARAPGDGVSCHASRLLLGLEISSWILQSCRRNHREVGRRRNRRAYDTWTT